MTNLIVVVQGGDPHSAEGGEGGKITEWEAAWNVTNAIQVDLRLELMESSNLPPPAPMVFAI